MKARSKRVRQNSGLQKERQNCIVEYLGVWGRFFHTQNNKNSQIIQYANIGKHMTNIKQYNIIIYLSYFLFIFTMYKVHIITFLGQIFLHIL